MTKPSWIFAGTLNFITACIHLIAGHFEMVLPLLASNLPTVALATLYACWHMVTIILFFSSVSLLYIGVKPKNPSSKQVAMGIGSLYLFRYCL